MKINMILTFSKSVVKISIKGISKNKQLTKHYYMGYFLLQKNPAELVVMESVSYNNAYNDQIN